MIKMEDKMNILTNSISNYRINLIIFLFCGLLIRRAVSYKFALLFATVSSIMIIQFLFFRYRQYKSLNIPNRRYMFIMEGLMLNIGNIYHCFINYYFFHNSSEINFIFILSLYIFFIPSQLANNKIKEFEK